MVLKTKIMMGLAALVIGLSSCGSIDENSCTSDKGCKGARVCYQGECVSPEEIGDIYNDISGNNCQVKAGFGGCENFSGVYEVTEESCPFLEGTNFQYVALEQLWECTHQVVGIKPNNTGKECLFKPYGDSPNTKGNHLQENSFEIIGCDDPQRLMMRWYEGCEASLIKESNESFGNLCGEIDNAYF